MHTKLLTHKKRKKKEEIAKKKIDKIKSDNTVIYKTITITLLKP
jgi:hypothetical protein